MVSGVFCDICYNTSKHIRLLKLMKRENVELKLDICSKCYEHIIHYAHKKRLKEINLKPIKSKN